MTDFLDNLHAKTREKVENLCKIIPEAMEIFKEVYHAGEISNTNESNEVAKKRRLNLTEDVRVSKGSIIFELNDVSVLSPLRKKLNFTISMDVDNGSNVLSLNKNEKMELTIPNISESIRFATFLPFPEKKTLVYLLISYELNGTTKDPILLTLNKEQVLRQFKKDETVSEESTHFQNFLDYMRRQAILTGFRISDPFSSHAMHSDHSFYVDCHRGSKEGFLFFLPERIIFGFKKPILLFNSQDIDAISYSSITRLTFNVTLITKCDDKFEFSMIDQNKFSEIDEYVKKLEVQDKSMSDELKAKTTKSGQTTDGSALREVLEESGTIEDVELDSEDDKNDANFEGETDLSDGSRSEEEEEDEEEEEEQEEADGTEEEEEEQGNECTRRKEKGMNDIHHGSTIDYPEGTLIDQSILETGKKYPDLMEEEIPLHSSNIIQEIPLQFEEDEEDAEDEEDSGVEYD